MRSEHSLVGFYFECHWKVSDQKLAWAERKLPIREE